MPEHETFDVEALFRELERDIADVTHAPAVARVFRDARKHRLTRWGGVAVAAAASVTIAVGVTHLSRTHEPGVTSQERGKPAYGNLTAEVLTDATRGWVGPWTHQPGGLLDDPPTSARCWSAAVGASDAYAESRGQNTYTSADGMSAELVGLAFGSKLHGLAAYADLTRALGKCGMRPDATYSYGPGTEVTHHTVSGDDANGLQLWTVESGQFVAIFAASGAADAPGEHTIARVSDAVVGALDGEQVFRDPAAPPSALRDNEVVVHPEDLAPALAGWENPWSPELPNPTVFPLSCLFDDDNDWMGYHTPGGTQMDEGHNGLYFVSAFATAADARAARGRLLDQLTRCSTPYAVHTVTSAAGNDVQVAVLPGRQVLWVAETGRNDVAFLGIPIDSAPPDSVSAKVADVMHSARTFSTSRRD